jgi:small-conductance mechanosensitive channel
MFKFLRHFILVCLWLVPMAVHAQTPQTQPVDETAVKQLITTLESETARADFVSNLKLLLETQNKDAGIDTPLAAPLSEALGVDGFTGDLVNKYQKILQRNGLKGSTVGKIGLSVGSTLFMFLLIFTARRGVTRVLALLARLFAMLDLPPRRLRLYGRVLHMAVTFGLVALLFYSYFVIWSITRHNPFESEWVKSTLKFIFNTGFVFVLAAVIWETLNALLQLIFKKLSVNNSSRAQTLMPIVRNILFILFALLFGLVLLSQFGINIVPILAGAGIVGVAIGFGAQTMVKDFLTGFTILLEDVVRVSDIVTIAGHTGTIEKITLRKIQLRDVNGVVFTIPFSEIKIIENMTKDFSFYPLEIGVSYANDTDHVCDVLRAVDADLRADSVFAPDMIEPIEILGVDRFADSAVIIKARLKTQPLRQWAVGREFNRRMKKAFDAAGIEIPFQQMVVTMSAAKNRDN